MKPSTSNMATPSDSYGDGRPPFSSSQDPRECPSPSPPPTDAKPREHASQADPEGDIPMHESADMDDNNDSTYSSVIVHSIDYQSDEVQTLTDIFKRSYEAEITADAAINEYIAAKLKVYINKPPQQGHSSETRDHVVEKLSLDFLAHSNGYDPGSKDWNTELQKTEDDIVRVAAIIRRREEKEINANSTAIQHSEENE